MIVLRFENNDGSGIYIDNREWCYDLDEETHNLVTWQRPTPNADGIEILSGVEVCGFACINQLKNWFPIHVLETMAKYDIRVKHYRVRKQWVKRGDWQVVFNKNTAICINELPVTNIIEYLKRKGA